jgi:large subunit ribosomal protein L14e
MMEIGRLVTKTHGHESGKIAVIVDVIDEHTVLIDGNVKRRKCNTAHLKPHMDKLNIKKGASTEEVKKIFEEKNLLYTPKKDDYKKRERKGSEQPKKGAKKANAKAAKGAKAAKPKKKKTEEEAVEDALKAAEK